MTETLSTEPTATEALPTSDALAEAVALIDRGLGDISERSLVSAGEVADLLLDVRSLLTVRPEGVSIN